MEMATCDELASIGKPDEGIRSSDFENVSLQDFQGHCSLHCSGINYVYPNSLNKASVVSWKRLKYMDLSHFSLGQ